MMKNLLLAFFMLALTFSINAKIIAKFDNKGGGFRSETHVFVVGYAGELSDYFLRAAITSMHRMRYLYPNDSLLLIKARDDENDRREAKNFGLKIITADNSELSLSDTYNAVARHGSRVASIQFFSHSAAFYGPGLQKSSRFNPDYDTVKAFKKFFTRDAFAGIYGCNTGWIIAPKLTKAWGIPVYGSLTSTDFQEYFQDGKWYLHNKGQYPTSGWFSSTNRVSNPYPVNCKADGACVRMRADNFAYSGAWGKYRAGLSFFKTFCPHGTSSCERAMAKMVMTYPTTNFVPRNPSREQYREHVIDFLCPRYGRNSPFNTCRSKLISLENQYGGSYNPFWDIPLECSFSECKYDLVSEGDKYIFKAAPKRGKKHQTIVTEYKHYMNGYERTFGRGYIMDVSREPEVGEYATYPEYEESEPTRREERRERRRNNRGRGIFGWLRN